MVGKVQKMLLVLWLTGLPLLIYLLAEELVFAGWNVFCGQVRQEQYLPLTAAAGAAASVILGTEYKRWKCRIGEKSGLTGELAVCAAVSGGAACLFFNGLLMFFSFPEEGYRQVGQVLYRPSLLTQMVCMGAVIPAGEELVFRGLGYGRIRKELSFKAAAVVSAVWFGLYHGNFAQGIYAGLLGIFLAVFYEKSHSLLSCWLFHGAANIMSVVMTRLLPKRQDRQGMAMMAAGVLMFGALRVYHKKRSQEEERLKEKEGNGNKE